jgi:hypothetical protein
MSFGERGEHPEDREREVAVQLARDVSPYGRQ